MLVVVFSNLSKKWWFFLILGWGMLYKVIYILIIILIILNLHAGPPVIFVAAGYTYGAFRGGYADINT